MKKRKSLPGRRDFLRAASTGLPLTLMMGPEGLADPIDANAVTSHPLRIVCVGAHPDDPESGCGGTLARYAEAGHRVTIIYLTRGEAGIPGKSHEDAASIRTAESEAACKILSAKPLFAGQVDGATEITRKAADALSQLIAREKPDVVFTHWPIDTHFDHQAASMLTIRAYLASRPSWVLYFFEVNSGSQTLGFMPTSYVDISTTRSKKKQVLFAHKSQDGERIYRVHHEVMETFRGRELGVAAAEAFVSLPRDNRDGKLPGL